MEYDLFSAPPPEIPQHRFSRRRVFLIIDVILGALILFSIVYLLSYKPPNKASAGEKNASSKSSSQSSKNGTSNTTTNTSKSQTTTGKNAPGVSTPASPNVAISYVTMQTGVTESKNTIGDYAATAAGHYAYIDGSTPNGDLDGATGGKMIYDGKVLYQGTDLVQDNVVISRNGLHYGFYRDDGTNYDIYIDGKLVNTNIADNETFTLEGVSNDGLHYAFDVSDPSTGDDGLYRDQALHPFYQGTGVFETASASYLSAFFSADLSRYVGFFTPDDNGDGNPQNKINANGALSSLSFSGNPQNIGISESGAHYFAITSNSEGATPTYQLVIDGKVITSLDGNNQAGVTDSGAYFYINNTNPSLVLNNKTINLPAADFNANEVGYEFAAINADASHYAVGNSDKPYWVIDGTPVSVTGDVYNVELVGNTLFVYRWSN